MFRTLANIYNSFLKGVVFALVAVSGIAVLTMMTLTCVDVILRLPFINHSLVGVYDIVKIAGAIALAAALPYTTAVRGHVAIEYFYQKFNRTGRLVLDTLTRLLGIALFLFLAWESVLYGCDIRSTGQVSQTLQLPVFWIPFVISFCCCVSALVILYNLTHPRREMIKP